MFYLLAPWITPLAPILLVLTTASTLRAQTTQGIPSDPSSSYDQAVTVPADPKATNHYVAPDVPNGWIDWTAYDGKYFSYKLGIVAIFDYDAFWQNSNSLDQVGSQRDQWDIRSFRIALGGKLGYQLPIKYFLSVEYKGLDRPANAEGWGSTDISLTTALGRPKYGSITVGKTKETFCYEMVGDAAISHSWNAFLPPSLPPATWVSNTPTTSQTSASS
jgi:hypothetical protein